MKPFINRNIFSPLSKNIKLTNEKVIHFIAGIDKTGGGTTGTYAFVRNSLGKKQEPMAESLKSICIEGVEAKFFNASVFDGIMLKEFYQFWRVKSLDIVHVNGIWNPQNWGFQNSTRSWVC
jgi:hypothetical protein